ncbi:chitobiase/beta-hexosaminidase C-terminal domain-containing protein [Oscillospiraceae bacterium CM]|nr:chitobiase/beta-hexosaminidase C-terminal domain-containing protein [Oscillospiraceae bacterium CM]
MSVNLTTKYAPLIAERFKAQSVTEAYAGKKYDFDGAQSIKIYTVDKVTLNDYSRTADGGRFGTIAELGDTIQTLTMSQDKAFTFSIDHGNAADQLNIKHCNEQLKSNWDEVCTPTIDMYRLAKWANGAGLGVLNTTALTTSTVMRAIVTAGAAMSNKLVPKKNRVLLIAESVYIETKLSSEIMGIDSLGEEAVKNGVVGRIDGMDVVPVVDSYLPAGVNFLIKYKDATVDPMKLKTMRVQKNPLGYDADVGECRFYHDSFVLDAKVSGIYVHAASGMLPLPTMTGTSTVTVTCADATTIKYTTDGSNPKTSGTASTYSAPVLLTAGQTLRAYGLAAGVVNSPIKEYTYTA